MTITTILGSPRKQGNTATVLTVFEGLISVHHTVNRFTVPARRVNGCLGCEACQEIAGTPGCVQRDAVGEILAAILHSNMVVYASPVYVWDFSAQMKALMDRHFCFVKWKQGKRTRYLLEGKPVLLLATCGGDAETNADLIREIFTREMNYLHSRIAGVYIIPNCTTPAALEKEALQTARLMVADVLRICPL